MKKIIVLLVLAVTLLLPMEVMAAGESITSLDAGYTEILFSNSYRGYCLDRDMQGAQVNDSFTLAADTSVATSNATNESVGHLLKAAFVQGFEILFEPNGSGGYKVKNDSNIQAVIWYYTEGAGKQPVWGDQKTVVNMVAAYSGPAIPDHGYTLTLENGDKITFDFIVIQPQNIEQQDFFGYRISVTPKPDHEHDGGEASCTEQAKCEVCEKPYGEVDPDNHGETEIRDRVEPTEDAPGYTGDTYCKDCGEKIEEGEEIPKLHKHEYGKKWKNNADKHWHECECGEKADEGKHVYSDGYCTVCLREQGVPKTGDGFAVYLWSALFVIGIGGSLAIVRCVKKRNSR